MKFLSIDSDTVKSGYCVYDSTWKEILEYGALNFWELIDKIQEYKSEPLTVLIECGFLNKKSNYHKLSQYTPKVANIISDRISSKVGANAQISKLLIEYCEYKGISYKQIKPTTKKMSKEMLFKLTGLKIANQDVIDSISMVVGL